MATNNAIDLSAQGVAYYNGSGSFSTPTLTQHAPVIGDSANDIKTSAALTNGQVLIGSTGADPVPATLTAGTNIAITNGAGSISIAASGSNPPISLSTNMLLQEDFFGVGSAFEYSWVQNIGGSPVSGVQSVSGHPGIAQTVDPANNSGLILSNNAGSACVLVLGAGAFTFRSAMVPSSTTSNKIIRIGLMDNPEAITPSGIYFQFNATTSANWRAVTNNAGTITDTSTGFAADLNWHAFLISINAAGTSITFTIDGAHSVTTTTNIPTAVLSPFFNVNANGSAVAQVISVDYIECTMILTTPR